MFYDGSVIVPTVPMDVQHSTGSPWGLETQTSVSVGMYACAYKHVMLEIW